MSDGKRVKLVIEAYGKPDFSGKVGEFMLQFNPENYNKHTPEKTKSSKLVKSNGEEIEVNEPRRPEQLEFEFYLDSSGIVSGCDDVRTSVNDLKKLALEINGDIHTKNYIKVRWDTDLVFPCTMEALEVEYLLFKPNGDPVRAKLKAKFKEFIDPETKAKQDNKNSPDLTHLREVVEGDTLPMMCYKIYGDCKYYLQVAEYNEIVNLSYLKPGQIIEFPPLTYANITSN